MAYNKTIRDNDCLFPVGGVMMIADMVVPLEQMVQEFEPKKAKKLNVQQLLNLINVLLEKNLIDNSNASREIETDITDTHKLLIDIFEDTYGDRTKVKVYKKAYNKLIAKVKEVFDLQPEGSVQSTYMAIGIALGTGIGTALMSATNSAFMSIGLSMGIVFGVSIGNKKEKEAKLAGKLF